MNQQAVNLAPRTFVGELREVPHHVQRTRYANRRWFASERADLFIWISHKRVESFEFCFDKVLSERAVRWHRDTGFGYATVDDGEANPTKNCTPITMMSAPRDLSQVALKFEAVAANLEPRLYRFVLATLLSDT